MRFTLPFFHTICNAMTVLYRSGLVATYSFVINAYRICTYDLWSVKVEKLRKVDQKYLKISEVCWRRVKKISWTDRERNGEVLQGSMRTGISYIQ